MSLKIKKLEVILHRTKFGAFCTQIARKQWTLITSFQILTCSYKGTEPNYCRNSKIFRKEIIFFFRNNYFFAALKKASNYIFNHLKLT